jgi:hypothetical protein
VVRIALRSFARYGASQMDANLAAPTCDQPPSSDARRGSPIRECSRPPRAHRLSWVRSPGRHRRLTRPSRWPWCVARDRRRRVCAGFLGDRARACRRRRAGPSPSGPRTLCQGRGTRLAAAAAGCSRRQNSLVVPWCVISKALQGKRSEIAPARSDRGAGGAVARVGSPGVAQRTGLLDGRPRLCRMIPVLVLPDPAATRPPAMSDVITQNRFLAAVTELPSSAELARSSRPS